MQSIPGPQIMSYWFFCYEIILLGGKIPLGHSVLQEQIMVPDADSEKMTAKFFSLKSKLRKKMEKTKLMVFTFPPTKPCLYIYVAHIWEDHSVKYHF